MKSEMIRERLTKLRTRMKTFGVAYVIIPTGDYHNSEYVSDFFHTREFYSGFTGSNGTLLVMEDRALLWTDGRYFVQAEKELAGTGIELMKMLEEGVPTLSQFVAEQFVQGQKIGVDSRIMTVRSADVLCKQIAEKLPECKEIFPFVHMDPAEAVWENRPTLPCNEIFVLPNEVAGERVDERVDRVRKALAKEAADGIVISKLDDIMWLFNIRGRDVECNPVALSYAYIDDGKAILFVQTEACTDALWEHAKQEGFEIKAYDAVSEWLSRVRNRVIMLDPVYTSVQIKHALKECRVQYGQNPTTAMKAVKNPQEIAAIRQAYLMDSVAVTRFLYYIKNHPNIAELNEYTAAMYLDGLRAELPGYIELSFPTISAYGANGAMMHYEATETDNAMLAPEGFLLVDSGGQYMTGTTDVTRTIALGPLTEQMVTHYTSVLRGHLDLAMATYMQGCTGRNLDILARLPMWERGIDYKCGTGHGIGFILNVHEGPQGIRWRYDKTQEEAILQEGMLVTDEPGVYLAGEYGIRTENVLLCRNKEKTADGQFMDFEMLTLVPYDIDAIDVSMLTIQEKEYLNRYHQRVCREISPYLDTDEQKWLQKVTRAI